MVDVEKLIRALDRLIDRNHFVVVIEHDLDVIVDAGWVIDLGPKGGVNGGRWRWGRVRRRGWRRMHEVIRGRRCGRCWRRGSQRLLREVSPSKTPTA